MALRAARRPFMLVPVLLAVAGVLAVRAAAAHDEYWWIEKPQYKTESGAGCCGPRDCTKVKVLNNDCRGSECVLTIEETGGRSSVRVNRASVYPSEDANSWVCRFGQTDRRRAQCAFIGLGM